MSPPPLPPELRKLIEAGRWARDESDVNRQSAGQLIARELVRRISADDQRVVFFPPPFATVAERSKSNTEFWEQDGALGEITPDECLDIGDFGHGSDSPLVLDFSQSPDEPRVLRLAWGEGGGEANHWVEVAASFDELVEVLDLWNADWGALRSAPIGRQARPGEPMNRPSPYQIGCLSIVAVVGVAFFMFMEYLGWNRTMEGMREAEPRAECPTRSPDQEFPLPSGFVLRVHDSDPKQFPPTVSLREPTGKVRWCVYAHFLGKGRSNDGAVRQIRFDKFETSIFGPDRVHGHAPNVNGDDTWWFISDEGDLITHAYNGLK